jgi:pimeloyl-ACP methyl ester carboxylesterase
MKFRLSIAILITAVTRAASQTQQCLRGYLDLNGLKIYYEECGSGSAVILLHRRFTPLGGVGGDVETALQQVSRRSFDRRGYGRSDPAKAPFSPDQDLQELMRPLQIERGALVGSASSSGLALDFAIAHPDKVEALFLIGRSSVQCAALVAE